MKRYLITGFLLIVPLYGMSMATAELVKSMGLRIESPSVIKPTVIASMTVTQPPLTPQLIKAGE